MNFKKAREAVGLTQEAVARKLGIGRSTVAMWEKGESFPRSDKLPEVARLFGCSIDELFSGEIIRI